MKIVVIGGNGLIGKGLVRTLRDRGHEAVAASRSTGVDVITGAGLAEAFRGADVVVDVTNAPSWTPADVLAFFETSGRNLAAAEKEAGVRHHVALSIVGVDRMAHIPYMIAKLAQERAIRDGGVPHTIVRATQFFDLADTIAAASTAGDVVTLGDFLMQPIASDDVVAAVADVATAAPTNGTFDLAGPEPIRIDAFVRRLLAARGDARRVVVDRSLGYFGFSVDDRSLVPIGDARHGATTLDAWLDRTAAVASV